MFSVLEVSKQEDLSQFSRLLWQRKISHRIHNLEDRQVLTVPNQEQVAPAARLYREWLSGQISPAEQDSSDFISYISPSRFMGNMLKAFLRAPVSLSLIVICCILLVLAPLNNMNDLARMLLYPDFSFGTRIINLERVIESFSFLTLAKMITPVFLHGGLIHLAFNMLWLWEFGRRIEAVQASWSLLILIVAIALVSNTAQFLYGGSIYFGGMSGVVYGLFSYIWMWQLFDPAKRLALPGALVFFLLLTLFVMTAMDLDFIADEAHIGGLLAGVVFGAITATASRIIRHTRREVNRNE